MLWRSMLSAIPRRVWSTQWALRYGPAAIPTIPKGFVETECDKIARPCCIVPTTCGRCGGFHTTAPLRLPVSPPSSRAGRIESAGLTTDVSAEAFTRPIPGNGYVGPIKCIPPTKIHAALYKHVVTDGHRVALVLGSPGCGKTSTACMFATWLREKGHRVHMVGGGDDINVLIKADVESVAPVEDFQGKPSRPTPDIIIVDEANRHFGNTDFTAKFIKDRRYYLVCFGTSAHVKWDVSPQVLRENRFWMFGPSVDRVEVQRYLSDVMFYLAPEGAQALRDAIAKSLFDFCGGNMNVTIATLSTLLEGRNQRTFPTTMEVVQRHSPRVIVNGTWEIHHKNLFTHIGAVGYADLGDWVTLNEEVKGLVRKGFVAPLRDYDDAPSAIVKVDPPDWQRVVAAHSWQHEYARLVGVKPMPTKINEKLDAAILHPFDLVLRSVSSLDVNVFIASRIAGSRTDIPATEYNFQGALLAAMTKCAPNIGICSEFPAAPSSDALKCGRIDFVAFVATALCDERWAIELVRNGHTKVGEDLKLTDAEEHKNRFETGGIYADAQINQFLIVDCLPSFVDRAPVSKGKWYVRIGPHRGLGWDVVVVEHKGKKLFVPRDGVPRVCPNLKADPPTVEPLYQIDYSRLTPKTVWVVQEGKPPAFQVTPTSNTIDGLKDAIKAKKPSLKDVDADRLTIYTRCATGRWTEMDEPDAPLQAASATAPYRFRVPKSH